LGVRVDSRWSFLRLTLFCVVIRLDLIIIDCGLMFLVLFGLFKGMTFFSVENTLRDTFGLRPKVGRAWWALVVIGRAGVWNLKWMIERLEDIIVF
jgi:hypothetical protein